MIPVRYCRLEIDCITLYDYFIQMIRLKSLYEGGQSNPRVIFCILVKGISAQAKAYSSKYFVLMLVQKLFSFVEYLAKHVFRLYYILSFLALLITYYRKKWILYRNLKFSKFNIILSSKVIFKHCHNDWLFVFALEIFQL